MTTLGITSVATPEGFLSEQVDKLELLVSIGVLFSFRTLAIGLKAIAHFAQKFAHHPMTDLEALDA